MSDLPSFVSQESLLSYYIADQDSKWSHIHWVANCKPFYSLLLTFRLLSRYHLTSSSLG